MTEARRTLLLLAAGGFVSGLTIRIAEPLLPTLADEFGVSIASAATVITVFSFAYGLFQLVHGPLGDRIGKLRTVAGALGLAGLACGACAFAGSLEGLAALRFLTGMTAGAVIPLSIAFVGDVVPFEERQPVLGRFIAGVLLGSTLGPLVGGVFSDHLGWRAAFLVPAAGFLVIGAALVPTSRRETAPRDRAAGLLSRYPALLRSARVRAICTAVGIEGFLFYGAFAYFGAFLRHHFELDYTTIGLVLAGFGAGGVLYSVLVKTLINRLGPARMVRLGGWLILVAFLVVAGAPDWALAAPPIAVLGLAFYMVHNTLQTRATEMAPQARGSAISVFAFCLFFGQALGVAVFGLAIELFGYRAPIAFAGIGLAILAAAIAGRLSRL